MDFRLYFRPVTCGRLSLPITRQRRRDQQMYERILAAVDESQVAERVLAAAGELAALSSGEVLVFHVWEGEPGKYKSSRVTSYEAAQVMVETAEEQLLSAGIKATSEVTANLYSHTAREITSYAKAHDVGVIVIGSRRRGDLTALIAGSTAHKVVHMADRPVVVVP
jgi:nucleotide-binding universal stress UspA family protein